ncbi:MAG: hypothetical protein ACE5D7_10435, partial [Fidelibacterota bacterium]
FAVRDHAEGMTYEDMVKSFSTYGASTSGLKDNVSVRGYFGMGAKDALATMVDGHIVTFKNGFYTECFLSIQDNKSLYRIEDSKKATKAIRNEHGIPENGTVAYFSADPNKTGPVPKYTTTQEALSKNYMLRKIMINPKRKIILINENKNSRIRLRYLYPEGKEVLRNSFNIIYGSTSVPL